jgi:hypothetical protein
VGGVPTLKASAAKATINALLIIPSPLAYNGPRLQEMIFMDTQ